MDIGCGALLLCVARNVKNDIEINENAIFAMNGTTVVGRFNKQGDIIVKPGATLL
jgi:hypothetical protein